MIGVTGESDGKKSSIVIFIFILGLSSEYLPNETGKLKLKSLVLQSENLSL